LPAGAEVPLTMTLSAEKLGVQLVLEDVLRVE